MHVHVDEKEDKAKIHTPRVVIIFSGSRWDSNPRHTVHVLYMHVHVYMHLEHSMGSGRSGVGICGMLSSVRITSFQHTQDLFCRLWLEGEREGGRERGKREGGRE